MELEKWKDVKGFIGIYKVSSLGRIISLSRKVTCRNGGVRTTKERILKLTIEAHGYHQVSLCFEGKSHKTKVHTVVAIAFLNHTPCNFKLIIDHKDNNKLNNRKDNLQITTMRNNTSKDQFRYNRTSKYTGVSWDKARNKWASSINIKGKSKRLGYFLNEIDAQNAYQKKILEITQYK